MMRIACLACLCLLFWAGGTVAAEAVDADLRPSLSAPQPAATNMPPALRSFASNDLKELLTRVLQSEVVKDEGELELAITRPWAPIQVPEGPLDLKVTELPASGLNSQSIIRFQLSSEGKLLGTWQAAVQARVWRDILVAAVPLKRGMALRESDVTSRRQDVLTVRDWITELPGPAEALQLADFVPVGGAVTSRALKARPVVRRGQSVEAIARSGALSVSMRVEAMEEGAPGQLIRIRNPQSRREMRGKVQDENTVVIPL